MNANANAFILTHAYGMTRPELEQLIQLERLCPVLCRFDRGRLTCPAQDAPEIVKGLEAYGWRIRDVAPLALRLELARHAAQNAAEQRRRLEAKPIDPDRRSDWQYEVANGDTRLGLEEWIAHKAEANAGTFDPSEVGGVLDGSQVTSDADPGL